MNKKLQATKDAEKKSANVQRTASYRLALRRSAPPESEDLLAKNSENNAESDQAAIISQPTTQKKVSIDDPIVIQPMIVDHKTNGDNGLKDIEFVEQNRDQLEGENGCTKFCCQTLCCNHCKCCPNCCSLQMKRLESLLIHCTECGLNCLRVFT